MVRVLCLVFAVSFAGYASAGEEVSVLAKPTNEVVAKEEPCCKRCKLYNVEEDCRSSCRNRLFGGVVKKTTVRKVYRPVR